MRDREYAWVIQRNDGKYWAWDSYKLFPNEWEWTLLKAKYYFDERDAESQCKKIRACRTECKPIKIVMGVMKSE